MEKREQVNEPDERFEKWPWSGLVQETSTPGERHAGDTTQRAILTWTDNESGERLTVAVEGTEPFLRALELEGFRRLAAEESDPLRGGGSGTEERPSAGRFGGRARAGSVPDLSPRRGPSRDLPDPPPRVAG